MPFSSLTDPIELARAEAALEKAWAELKPWRPEGSGEQERTTSPITWLHWLHWR